MKVGTLIMIDTMYSEVISCPLPCQLRILIKFLFADNVPLYVFAIHVVMLIAMLALLTVQTKLM